MAKLLEAITALEANEATKGLATALRAELGELAGVDAAALTKRLAAAEGNVAEYQALIKDLEPKAKGAEVLQQRVAAFEAEKRNGLVETSVAAKAKDFGLKPSAVKSALKLADFSGLKVDLEKGTVEGLSKDVFDGLRKDHPVLFEESPAVVPAVPALPSGGGGGAARRQVTRADLAAGKVQVQDIREGKVEVVD